VSPVHAYLSPKRQVLQLQIYARPHKYSWNRQLLWTQSRNVIPPQFNLPCPNPFRFPNRFRNIPLAPQPAQLPPLPHCVNGSMRLLHPCCPGRTTPQAATTIASAIEPQLSSISPHTFILRRLANICGTVVGCLWPPTLGSNLNRMEAVDCDFSILHRPRLWCCVKQKRTPHPAAAFLDEYPARLRDGCRHGVSSCCFFPS